MKKKVYSIGETAKITGISQQTLRYYDSIKLVMPEVRNSQTNYRYYSRQQIVLLFMIRRLRNMGCGISAVRRALENKTLEDLYRETYMATVEMEKEIERLQDLVKKNDEFLCRITETMETHKNIGEGKEQTLPKEGKIEMVPQIYLCAIRRVLPNYNVYDTSVELWTDLYRKCEKLGLSPVGGGVVTYHTELLGQFVMRDCEMTLGLKVEHEPVCSEIQPFGGVMAATMIHKGSYETMIQTHIDLLKWINMNHYKAVGEVSEEFMFSPIEAIDPELLTAKVIVPVQKC